MRRVYFALIFLRINVVFSALPGQPCSPIDPTLRCQDPNSICTNHICICTPNYFQHNDACIPLPEFPSDLCDPVAAPCNSIPNTECHPTDSICACLPNYGHDTLNNCCILRPLRPGDVCARNSVPCDFDNPPTTECGPIRPPPLGDSICECLDGKVTDTINGKCLTRPTSPGDSCHPTFTPCVGVVNTTCIVGNAGEWFCDCVGDLILHPVIQTCLFPPKNPGDLCDEVYNMCDHVDHTLCELNATTSKHVCTCESPLVTDFYARECLTPPSLPGDPCHSEHTPCSPAVPLTTCASDLVSDATYCKCISGYVNLPHERRCLALPTLPGQACHPTLAPCGLAMNNTLCTQNQCLCVGDLITDLEFGRCLTLPLTATKPCHPSLAPCTHVPNSDCNFHPQMQEFTCSCKLNYILNPENGTCLSLPVFPGDSCDLTLPLPCDSVANATTCFCQPGTTICFCKCDAPLINDPDGRRCLSPPMFPYDLCHPIAAPCNSVPNTICSRGMDGSLESRCVCVSGHFHDPLMKRCIPQPQRPGDPCIPTLADCGSITNTTCEWLPPSGHICKCLPDLVTDSGVCFPPPRHPGDRCSSTLAPCTSVAGTMCETDHHLLYPYCRCGGNYFTDFEARTCVPLPVKPGQPCYPGGNHCDVIPNTDCLTDGDGYICVCRLDYFSSSSGVCVRLPMAPLQPCELNWHCGAVPGTECLATGICTCIPTDWDLSSDLTKCLRKADALYQPCESDQQCSKLSNTICVLQSDNSTRYMCSCLDDHVPSSTLLFCLRKVYRIGDSCLEDLQCSEGIGDERIQCNNASCTCPADLIPNPDRTECIPNPDADKECLADEQCWETLGQLSYCVPLTHVCECFANATLIQDQCRYGVNLGEDCQFSEECVGNWTECDPLIGKCRCVPGHVPIPGGGCGLNEGGGIGSSCTSDAECANSIKGRTLCHLETRVCVCVLSVPVSEFECASNCGVNVVNIYTVVVTLLLIKLWGM